MKTNNRSEQALDGLAQSGFAEVVAKPKAHSINIDMSLELRLQSWGLAMVYSGRSGGKASTFWATEYITNRNAHERRIAIDMGFFEPKSRMLQIEEQLRSDEKKIDAWLIESAWRLLASLEHKQILRMKYISKFDDDVIHRRLRLRGRQSVQLILWRAKFSLQQILSRGEKRDTIQSYNLIAGNVHASQP